MKESRGPLEKERGRNWVLEEENFTLRLPNWMQHKTAQLGT